MMQRLHERDLSALCEDLGFETVRLPAEAEVQTTIVFPVSGRTFVRETGDVLWTARESHVELAAQKRVLGSEAYAGQYQQRPVPAGGAIFQRAWFQLYDELPPELDDVTQSWDMAFKDGPDNDYVVGLVGGQIGADVYVMDRVKGQWSFSESCRQVDALRRKHPASDTILIEDAANGPAIVNALAHRISGIIAVRPDGGKLARARAVQPMVEA
ncbi:MAG TPA: hypothetical protein VNJ04_20235, partial [Gemmatimonadaceae bacterium]|nr:hypothetical protein [Gemmatimonadaceae bacterium]